MIRFFFCFFILVLLFLQPVFGQGVEGYSATEYLPAEVQPYVDFKTVQGLEQGQYGVKDWLARMTESLFSDFKMTLSSFFGLFCALFLFSTLQAIQRKEQRENEFSEYACMLCLVLPTLSLLSRLTEQLFAAMNAMHTAMQAMVPAITALLVLGGNAQGAAVQGSMFTLSLAVLENLLHHVLLPLFSVLLAFSVLGGICMDHAFGSLLALLRKSFLWLFAFFFGFLALVLGWQTTIAQGADTVSARAVKFALGSSVPIVGGALGESVRTLAGSIAVLRGTIGAVGVLCLISLLFPVLSLLVQHQLLFACLGITADFLGLVRPVAYFSRLQELFKIALGLLLGFFLFFVFLFTVFSKCQVAFQS